MKIYVYDLETTGLKADVHSLLVACFGEVEGGQIKRYHSRTILGDEDKMIEGGEEALVKWARQKYMEADILIGYNSLSFDRNFLNGASLRYGLDYLPRKINIDVFQTLKGRHKYSSLSLEAVADALGLGAKDKPERKDWREGSILWPEAIRRLEVRCRQDVKLTHTVWEHVKHIYMERWGR